MKNPSKHIGNELKYLEKVLNQESWSSTGGSWVNNFEKEFAKRFNMNYAIATNSGTATLHAALEAVGVLPGDEVIVPPLSVVMSTTSVLHANAIPVYADVDLQTFNLDPEDVLKKITKKTKAIVPVAIYGLPANLCELRKIADKNNIALIEDNAQCVLGEAPCINELKDPVDECDECGGSDNLKSKLSGTFGDFSSYSFENTKHLSCGEGGLLLTNDELLAEKARKIAGHGFKNLRAEEGRVRLRQEIFQNPNYLRHDMLGWNYRMPEFNAAIVLAQFERIDELVDLRIKNAEIFLEVLEKYDFFIPQHIPNGYVHSYYTLGVVYDGEKDTGVPWNKIRKNYVDNGGDGIYSAWAVTYNEPVIKEGQFKKRYPEIYNKLNLSSQRCKNAEFLQKRIMQFKTNYRDIDLAYKKAKILKKTLKDLFGH